MNYIALLGVLCLAPAAFVAVAYLIVFRKMPDDLELRARKRFRLMSRSNMVFFLVVIAGLLIIAEGVAPASPLIKTILAFFFVVTAFLPLVVVTGLIDRRVREIEFPFKGYLKFQFFFFLARWLSIFVVVGFLFFPVDLTGPDGRIAPSGVGIMAGAALLFVLALLYQMRIVGRLTGTLGPEREGDTVGQDVSRLSEKAKIGRVRVLIMDTYGYPFLNAFAAPWRIVYITRPLIETLTRDELSAVAAHEIGHLVTMKMRTFLVLSLMVLFVVAVWVGVPRLFLILSDVGAYLVPIVVFVLLALGLLIAVQAVSRRYETVADRISSELMGGPEPMIAALEKIYRLNMLPRRFDKKGSENASHPSLERRVAQLKGEKLPAPKKRLKRMLLVVALFLLIFGCLRLLSWLGERSISPDYPARSDEIIGSLEARLERDPDDVEALKGLSVEYFYIGDDERALETVVKAQDLSRDPGLLVLQGFILDALGNQSGALYCMEEAYRLGGSLAALRWATALAAERGDSEKAREYLSKLRIADPADPFVEQMERYLSGDGQECPFPDYHIVFQGSGREP